MFRPRGLTLLRRACRVDDQFLTVLMYPEYPGRFLFVLQDKEVELVTVQTEETQPQTQAQSRCSRKYRRKRAQVYDASTLSVTGIPSVLANYGGKYDGPAVYPVFLALEQRPPFGYRCVRGRVFD